MEEMKEEKEQRRDGGNGVRKQGVVSCDSIDSRGQFSTCTPLLSPTSASTSTEASNFSTSSSLPSSISRRVGMIRVGQTRGTLFDKTMSSGKDHFVQERYGWYSGSLLRDSIDLLSLGSSGNLDSTPTPTEFEICCHALWSRHGETSLTTPASSQSEEITPEVMLENAVTGMDTQKAIQAILDGVVITPELIERTSVHLGDKYIPLVAILLSKCVPFVAKRILLNDCKEIVMRCNNPLTALMIGHHISRSI